MQPPEIMVLPDPGLLPRTISESMTPLKSESVVSSVAPAATENSEDRGAMSLPHPSLSTELGRIGSSPK